MRKVSLTTNNIYHIFNRGVNKAPVFFGDDDRRQFIKSIVHYLSHSGKLSYRSNAPSESNEANDSVSLASGEVDIIFPKVEILAYCLMPNHFHLLLKQKEEGGITWFMRRAMNSYVHFINVKHKRVGPLFQGRFKSVHIETDEQLIHLSRYIHLNPVVGNLVKNINDYPWSSFQEYFQLDKKRIVNADAVLNQFADKKAYEQFVIDHIDYAKMLDAIKHLTFED